MQISEQSGEGVSIGRRWDRRGVLVQGGIGVGIWTKWDRGEDHELTQCRINVVIGTSYLMGTVQATLLYLWSLFPGVSIVQATLPYLV